jgi:hypothetical protein
MTDERGTRPPELPWICLLLGVAVGVGYFSYQSTRSKELDLIAACSALLMLAVIACFWAGQEWARWLIVLGCLYALIRPVILVLYPPMFESVVIVVEAVLAVPLMIWLTRKRVTRYTLGNDG